MTELDGPMGQWRAALQQLTASRDSAQEFRRERYRFAHALAERLTADGHSDGHVVYGVQMDWGPLYVGQTREGRRRIRDLVIGESHHLANTFPPEIWRTVVVIKWPQLPTAAEALTGSDADEVGLALEYLLQSQLQPLFNAHKRTRAGSWRATTYSASRSLAAHLAHTPALSSLADDATMLWNQATQNHGSDAADSCCFAVYL